MFFINITLPMTCVCCPVFFRYNKAKKRERYVIRFRGSNKLVLILTKVLFFLYENRSL